jgi:hypothetical protein
MVSVRRERYPTPHVELLNNFEDGYLIFIHSEYCFVYRNIFMQFLFLNQIFDNRLCDWVQFLTDNEGIFSLQHCAQTKSGVVLS